MARVLSSDLIAHLHRGMAEPFRRPDMDCVFFAVDWIVVATGTDPAGALRGSYRSAHGAARIIARHGGFVRMWRGLMERAGFSETSRPQDGDVGVVTDAAGQVVAAIRIDGKWCAKSEHGVVIEDFSMLVAWSVPGRG